MEIDGLYREVINTLLPTAITTVIHMYTVHVHTFMHQHKIIHMYIHHTIKTENCAVVLLCVLMDYTLTIDVMWIFLCCFFYLCAFLCTKMQVYGYNGLHTDY